MKREEFSLMIFPFGYDLMQGTMSMQDIFDLTAQAGIPTVDVLGINRDFQPACRDAIDKSGVKVYCFIACISFFQEAERIRSAAVLVPQCRSDMYEAGFAKGG